MKRFAVLMTALMALVLLLAACSPAAPQAVATPTQPAATATTAPTATAQPATPTVEPTSAPTATQSPSATPEPLTFTDALGNTITLSQPAQRIISLAPSNTEILFALGAGSQVIARDDFSNYPEEATQLPSVGGSMMEYNLEEITRLQPDLLLASPLTPPEQVKAMQEITPNVYVLPNPKSLDDLYANLETVGKLTGRTAEAEALVTDLRARAQAVLDKVAAVTEKPKVFYELDATDPAKPWTAGPGTFIELLINLAGGENLGSALSGEWAQISQEELIVQNPDIILLGDALYGGITPEQVAARPGWSAIAAVKNNQVFAFNDDLVSRPGPRMIDGLEEMAKIFHPELFK